MTQQDPKYTQLTSFIKEYIEQAIINQTASWKGDHKKANRAHTRLTRVYHKLRALGREGRDSLVQLLSHNNPAVVAWAATHVLSFAPELAVPVLERLEITGDGAIKLSAKWILKQWKNGTFPAP
jgi:hypothetical protein